MKELDALNNAGHRQEVQAKRQEERQLILDGIIAPQRGHTIFEVNTATGEISEAKFRSVAADFAKALKGDFAPKRELVIVNGCVYIPALNKASAQKKFLNNPNQSAYYKKSPAFVLGYDWPKQIQP